MSAGWQWLRESPRFGVLLASRTVSRVGDVLFALAAAWTVLGHTHSVFLAAVVPLLTTLPPIVLALPLAALADRWPKKLVMVISDWGRALLVATAGVLLRAGDPIPGVLYGVTLLLAVGGLLFSPAVTAVIPRVVPPKHLARANGLWTAVMGVLSIGSYAVGGLLIAWLSPGWALIVDAVTFAVSGGVLCWLRIPDVRAKASRGARGLLTDSAAGLRDLWGDRYLRRLILVLAPMNLVFGPFPIFSLVFSRLLLHAGIAGFGTIEAASGLGSVAAGALVGKVSPWLTLQGWVCVAAAGSGAALGLALLARNLAVAVMCYGLIWFLTGVVSIPFVSAIQGSAPSHMVGRVMSALLLLMSGLTAPLGLLVGSWAMGNFGPLAALWAQAATLAAVAAITLGVRLNPPALHPVSHAYRILDAPDSEA